MALQPEWRREVSTRLRSYRERRHKPGDPDSQPALPFGQEGSQPFGQFADQHSDAHQHLDQQFDEATDAAVALDDEQYEDPLQATLAAAAARISLESAPPPLTPKRVEPVQHLLIDVSRPPELDEQSSALPEALSNSETAPLLDSDLLPVADLGSRRRAAVVDLACILLAFGVILGAFVFFGGRLAVVKLDALICGAILVLLYTQYFTLFTMMGGATPGMMLTGLRLVSFDGSAPNPRQLIWRSLGYLLSGGIMFLGFLWSFWDEDQLTWHDRISRTYLTPEDTLIHADSSSGSTSGLSLTGR